MCLPQPEVNDDYLQYQEEQAQAARDEEAKRQAEIQTGLDEIALIFEGGTAVPLTQPGDGPAEPVTYGGIQPYLDQRERAMKDFYMPQLQDQFSNTTRDLTFALNDAGLLTSTVAGDRQADLTEAYAMEEGKILADIASDIAGQTSMINQQRASIENALRASGDQSAAIDQSLTALDTFASDAPTLDPLAPLFTSILQGIGAGYQGYQTGSTIASTRPAPLGSTSYGRNVA